MNEIINKIPGGLNTLIPLLSFLAGWLIPNSMMISLGYKLGMKLPKPILKIIAPKLEALYEGMIKAEHEGDSNLVNNETVKKMIEGTKIDLGLTE